MFFGKARFTLLGILSFFSTFLYTQEDYRPFNESQYKKQTYPEPSGESSQSYAFIGMYKEALMEEEKRKRPSYFKSVSKDVDLEARNAYPYIYDAIRNNKIVILNEAHNIPLHRVLLYNILDSLSSLGVHSVFLETLAYQSNDAVYMNPNSNDDWGFYALENIFKQVVYKLKQSGIHVYSYEMSFNKIDTATFQGKKCFISKTDTNWIPIEADNYLLTNFLSTSDFDNRELEQALKIYQKLKKYNIDKALIFCGYAHGWRQGRNMVDVLEHLLERNVFTIDQTILNERINRALEDSLYNRFASSSYPFVIINKKQQPLHTVASITEGTSSDKFSDLLIGSPRSVYVNNRPTWLELNGDRKRYPLSKFMDISTYTDFLVCVYTPEELQKKKEFYTPDDVFQVIGNGKDYDVMLKPNKNYQLKVTKDNKVVVDKAIHTYK